MPDLKGRIKPLGTGSDTHERPKRRSQSSGRSAADSAKRAFSALQKPFAVDCCMSFVDVEFDKVVVGRSVCSGWWKGVFVHGVEAGCQS